MRRLLLAVAIGGLGLAAFLVVDPEEGVTPVSAPLSEAPKAAPVTSVARTVGLPRSLIIPKLSTEAQVQWLGLDQKGSMDVPNNWHDAGWFKLGPRPGEVGNAVIAGHLDGPNGAPGIFLNLDKLKAGDIVSVVDDQTHTHRFKVTRTQLVDALTKDLTGIFGAADKPHLNLITCSGVWSKKSRQYDKRLVVYTDLVP